MAMQLIELPQLEAVLLDVIEQVMNDRPTTAYLFMLLYRTGLRIGEALEVDRWTLLNDGNFSVQLSKREDLRIIAAQDVPVALLPNYSFGRKFQMETYSAVNNTFKYWGSGLLFESKQRRTTCHAFRYRFIKSLRAQGLSITEIAAIVGHKVEASTQGYVLAQVWYGGPR